MKLLSLDTTNTTISAALFADGYCLVHDSLSLAHRHTPPLSALFDKLLIMGDVSLNDITHVAVAVGPGRFTGLRLGYAFATGVALSGNYPLIGIGSLDAVASLFSTTPYVLAFIHGGRDDAFACLYIKGIAIGSIAVVDMGSLTTFLMALPIPPDSLITAVGSAPVALVDALLESPLITSFHACDSAAVSVGSLACSLVSSMVATSGFIPRATLLYGRTPSYKTLVQPLTPQVLS